MIQRFYSWIEKYSITEDGHWTIKGFIDTFQNVYTVSLDTKVISKVLEIYLFPKIVELTERL